MKKVTSLALAFLLSSVGIALAQFIIPQGPLTVTATENVYIRDLDLSLLSGQSQDMGAWYTQKELNESWDLKHAYEHGKVSFATAGTTPQSVSVSLGVIALGFLIPQGPLLITAPAGPNDVYIKDLDLRMENGSSQDMGVLFTQNQINTSNDLKSAIIQGKIVVGPGTVTPIPDAVLFSGGLSLTDNLDMGGFDILNIGAYPSLSDQLDAISVATTTFVLKSGDSMSGDLNMTDNQILNISSGNVNGSWDVDGRINGVKWFDPVDTNALKLLACPLKPCMVYNLDLDDVFTSTGILAGQWRNTRTGAGPGYGP